jgi:hypothetical protein
MLTVCRYVLQCKMIKTKQDLFENYSMITLSDHLTTFS